MQVYYCCAFDLLHSTEGVFNFKQCCADLSLYHLKACRTVCSLALVGTWMSYTDLSVQRSFRSNTPRNSNDNLVAAGP